jgi:hypothetical protein
VSNPDPRQNLPILGVVAHNYLRETGFRRMMSATRIAFFGSPDSALHRIADYSCPLKSLDWADPIHPIELESAVLALESHLRAKDEALSGLLSMRDPNVLPLLRVAWTRWNGSYGNLPRTPNPDDVLYLQSKHKTRAAINDALRDDVGIHTPIRSLHLSSDLREKEFCQQLNGFLDEVGVLILKPDRGSCSYYIKSIECQRDVPHAWRLFRDASAYRKGDFIAEEKVSGIEMAVETIVDDDVRHVALTGYLPPDQGRFYETGHFVPATITHEQALAIELLSRMIHHKLKLRHIITHMEIILPEQGPPAVVELNPRLAGDLTQELHYLVSGIDYYRIAAYVATGRRIPQELLTTQGRCPCA